MTSVKDLHDLDGRVAVITGGAGHLGRAMAAALLELGCKVAVVDYYEDDVQDAARSIGIDPQDCFTTDLASFEARVALAQDVRNRFGQLNILINNAAFVGSSDLDGWVGPFEQQTVETWRRALEVNLTAPFHLVQLWTDLLKAAGNGSIINLGSIYGMLGPDWSLYKGTEMGNPAAYAASKGGLLQLTKWLSTTLAPHVRVNAISPGGIERGQPEAFVERYVQRTPLGRMGRESDFLGIVGFLASDASAWVTGQNFSIDGGWTAW